jgi:imidazole glycerol-phosphate synthase subunit HisH
VTRPSVALIDYHAGNLTSVKKALAAVGASVFVPATPEKIIEAAAVIVPGVGHFDATRTLGPEWIEAILQHIGEGRPLLGICLGMQWLFEGSEEAPDVRGLGVLSGECRRLKVPPGSLLKIPHVGWNAIDKSRDGSIVEGISDGAQAYFTHSYVAPITGDTVASTEHGEAFASVVQHGQIAGVQFHPEKSGDVGLQILRNWLRQAA